MKFKNNYYILRHGQTIYQTKKKNFIYPRPLVDSVSWTKTGKRQIKMVAAKMKKMGPLDLIYSSDMHRTRETAKIIVNALNVKKICFTKKLRDVKFGIYQGRKKAEFYRNFPRLSKMRFSKAPKKGESWLEVQKRVLDFLKEIDRKHRGQTILIVSHADPLWLLEGAVKKWSMARLLRERKNNFINVAELRKL